LFCVCDRVDDYTGELSISDEILKRVTESYRRIRNTLRFLLSNTSDSMQARILVPGCRHAGNRTATPSAMNAMQGEILAHYKIYEFHPVISKLQMYCSEDFGGFYSTF